MSPFEIQKYWEKKAAEERGELERTEALAASYAASVQREVDVVKHAHDRLDLAKRKLELAIEDRNKVEREIAIIEATLRFIRGDG